MRTGLLLILVGLFVALSGLFLSHGYDPNDGFLASMPSMGMQLTSGVEQASFKRASDQGLRNGPLISFQRTSSEVFVSLPRPMEDYEIAKVLKAFDEQYPDGTDLPKYFQFEGWKTVKPAFWLPLGLLVVVASALILVGMGLMVFRRLNRR